MTRLLLILPFLTACASTGWQDQDPANFFLGAAAVGAEIFMFIGGAL